MTRIPRGGQAAVTYAFFVAMLGTTLPTPLYALYRERFDLSQLTITVIFATYAVGVITALVAFGRASDELGRRWTLLGGLALSALSAIVFLATQGLGLLLVGRVLSGLSAGIFTGTATAAIVDFAEPGEQGRPRCWRPSPNMGGLGVGPLLAGILAQWAPDPLRLSFFVHLALLALAALVVWRAPETVRVQGRPRLAVQPPSVPPEVRDVFVRAATAGFAGFAILGLFTAVAPAFLAQIVGVRSHAVAGLVVFAVFAASTVGQAARGTVSEPTALVGGCAAMVGGMAVLAAGLATSSLVLLVAGGVVAGTGQGLSFRAALGSVTVAAPAERRAETSSAFFVVAYVALSLPVVGVGALAQAASLRTAGLVFAAAVAAVASTALVLLRARAGPT